MTKRQTITTHTLRLATAVILIVLLLLYADLGKTLETLLKVSPVIITLAIFVELLFYCIESYRIREFARRDYSWNILFRTRMASVFLGNFLPGFATSEIARVFLIDRYKPGNKVKVLSILLLNRLYGLLSLILILFLCMVFSTFAPGWVHGTHDLIVWGALPLIFTPLLFNFKVARKMILSIIKYSGKFLRKPLSRAYLATKNSAGFYTWTIGIISSMFTSLLAIYQFYLAGVAVGASENFIFWAIVTPLVSLSSFLPLGIGAIGPQDASLVAIAKFTARDASSLLAVSLIIHAIRFAGSLFGLLYLDDIRFAKANKITEKVID
jgi:uncharacterized protein (TIRG00374 family)